MSDAVSILHDNVAKSAQRVQVLRAKLIQAEKDLAELQTAVRVLERLGLTPEVVLGDNESVATPTEIVLSVLGKSENEAKAPREIAASLPVGSGISSENVRKILSRLARSPSSQVRVKGGQYWHTPSVNQQNDDASSFKSTIENRQIIFDDLPEIPILARPNK